jgi:hypothetical protein
MTMRCDVHVVVRCSGSSMRHTNYYVVYVFVNDTTRVSVLGTGSYLPGTIPVGLLVLPYDLTDD